MPTRLTPTLVQRQMHDLTSLLIEAELILEVNPIVREQTGNGIVRLTWPNSMPLGMSANAAVSEYLQYLRDRQFSLLFLDGSFVQLSYDFLNDDLVRHRLVYFPNPVAIGSEDIEDFISQGLGIADLVEARLAEADAAQQMLLRPVLRFDFDQAAAAENHPAAHLHLADESCRIPIFAPLDPTTFLKFTIRHFLSDAWGKAQALQGMAELRLERTVTAVEERSLHFNALE